MWKFIVFCLVVLLILMFIQVSTLSDSDVEKIRSQLEAQNRAETEKTNSDNLSPAKASSESIVTKRDDSQEPAPVKAYEEFLNAIPEMSFFSETGRFINPKYTDAYKEQMNNFASNGFKAFQDLHDLTAMEYMGVNVNGDVAQLRFIASSKLVRDTHNVLLGIENAEGLTECLVELSRISGNWFINGETWQRIEEVTSQSEEERVKRRDRLSDYYSKRQNR